MPSAAGSRPVDLLASLGHEVRGRRRRRGWTLREAAAASGLSTRFLADVEAGRGNISVTRLADLARALGCRPGDLLDRPPPSRVALLGLRGAGKSTVGARLAGRMGVPFVELDQKVEEAAGLPLAEVFAVHGEAYYRRLEREALARLLAAPGPFVLATGGGLVSDADTWAMLRGAATTVWLRARPEQHMARVAAQGDLRPMARRADALAEVRAILGARSSLYAQADHAVDTSDLAPDEVAARVAALAAAR
jgi:XRE family aerobic/anaerobic benzoate catabolism transcriptional regulator